MRRAKKIKPINKETDYQVALKEIEKLLKSQPGTPEGDQMDVLVNQVVAYEVKNFPFPEPDDPVKVLEYYLENWGLSLSDWIELLKIKK